MIEVKIRRQSWATGDGVSIGEFSSKEIPDLVELLEDNKIFWIDPGKFTEIVDTQFVVDEPCFEIIVAD